MVQHEVHTTDNFAAPAKSNKTKEQTIDPYAPGTGKGKESGLV